MLVTFGAGDDYRAMGMLRRLRPGMWETFQPSQLPLGAFLLRKGTPVDGILDGLLRALPGLAVAVGLTQQDPAIVARPPDSLLVETLDYIETATLTLGGTFDDYWSARGKNLRHNVKRQRAKLLEQSVPLKLDVIDTPERVAGGDRRLRATRRLGLEGAQGDGGRRSTTRRAGSTAACSRPTAGWGRGGSSAICSAIRSSPWTFASRARACWSSSRPRTTKR